MTDARPPKPVNQVFALGELVRRAMQTSYGMIARESDVGLETAASVEAVIELLVTNGLVDATELAALRERALDRIAGERAATWEGPWLTIASEDAAKQPDAIVDCTTRRPQCKAACCSFYRIALTEREVRGGQLLWDLGAPYTLPRAAAGHCAYLDAGKLACTVWHNRPHVCRKFDCSSDREIWHDFETMVPTERVVAMSRKHGKPK